MLRTVCSKKHKQDTLATPSITSEGLKLMQRIQKWLTTEQVAEEMQVTERTVQRMCRRGELSAVKFGHQWRINPAYKGRSSESKEEESSK